MRVGIGYGNGRLQLEVADERMVGLHRAAPSPAVADPAGAVREALEHPLGFPALRRALTPDDHVAVVMDEGLPHLAALLTEVLEHITSADVRPEAITLLCQPPNTGQPWVDELPDAFQEVRVEVHDPTERKRLAYLATTRNGRRVYLNRTAVDADQLVVLTRRGYDAALGYAGAEGAIFPGLSDEATRREAEAGLKLDAPGGERWPLRREAAEVAWLLGAPFLVQVIEGEGDEVAHIVGGVIESSGEGERLLDARWRVEADRPADVVVAGVSGDPARGTFADLARAAASAARVVRPGGRIVLLAGGDPALGEAAGTLRRTDDAPQALRQLREHTGAADHQAAFQWASAAEQARLYLLSGMSAEVAEELFAVPLDDAGQVQRLVGEAKACVFLPDAHKSLAVLRA
jgi:nickel-dependent lactate racemase